MTVPNTFVNGTLTDADDVNENFTHVDDKIDAIIGVPIGSVQSWLKSYTNTPALPDGWVECDGSTLSDAESVYDGQVIPNLNGTDTFLRGNNTSGGTGGGTTNSTSLNVAGTTGGKGTNNGGASLGYVGGETSFLQMEDDFPSGGQTFNRLSRNTNSFSILPTYYSVVWIMRIK